jgi:hypothetical protein
VRTQPISVPKFGALIQVIDAILDADETVPVKERHTAKVIWRPLSLSHVLTRLNSISPKA